MQFAGGERGFARQLVQRNGSLCLHVSGGIQGATIGSHQFRQVTPCHLGACQQFDGAHHGIIPHRAALHEDVLAQGRHVFQFQHLIKTILHHGVGQPGGNVLHRGPLAQHLLHLGVHEHRATAAQVARMLGLASQAGKLGGRVSQVPGKGLDERTATGGTGLIDFYAVDDTFRNKHGLHVLPADVEDERDLLVQVAGGQVVGNGLHNAPPEAEGGFYQILAIAGGATSADNQLGVTRLALFLQLPQAVLHRAYRVAFIVGIIGIHHPRLPVGHDNLGRGGARIYADEDFLASFPQRCLGDGMLRHAHLPQPILHLVLENRRKPSRLSLVIRSRPFPQRSKQLRKPHFLLLPGRYFIQGGTQGRQLRPVGGQDNILFLQR